MTRLRATTIATAVLLLGGGVLRGQFAGKMKNPRPQDTTFKNPPTLQTSIDVRDAFINRIGEDGFYCRLPAPAIVVADTPLFGEYEKNTDTIVTPDWKQLTPPEKAIFLELAGAGASEEQAKGVFDMEAHHWILVVEAVHWWEACKELTLKLTPYQAELQASRVALAYWRERDPGVVERLSAISAALDKGPSLLPPEQDVPTYFNQHYQKAASGKEYLWMQAQVVKAVLAESPEPALVQTVSALK